MIRSRGVIRAGFLLALLAGAASLASAQNKYLGQWPEGADPQKVGKRLAEHFTESGHAEGFVTYQEVCAWHGALWFATVTKDAALRSKLEERLRTVLLPENVKLVPDKEHVDFDIFGAIPLESSLAAHDDKLRALGLKYADRQWNNRRRKACRKRRAFGSTICT